MSFAETVAEFGASSGARRIIGIGDEEDSGFDLVKKGVGDCIAFRCEPAHENIRVEVRIAPQERALALTTEVGKEKYSPIAQFCGEDHGAVFAKGEVIVRGWMQDRPGGQVVAGIN